MKQLNLLLLLYISFYSINDSYAQISVTNATSIQQLVLDELIGPGISASTIVFTGDSMAIGTFTGSSNLDINEGIIIASGRINVAIGPNNYNGATEGGGSNGDADLSILSACATYDAAAIEFDFIPLTDSIEMSYIYASEEYPEFVCIEFTDVFAIFLSGHNPKGGTYNKENIALIPSTNLPVGINSINPGSPGSIFYSDCISLAYSSLYNDNTSGTTIEFDGFTDELIAYAYVIPLDTYHIKIAIADGMDHAFDSGLFIRKNSLKCVGMYAGEGERENNAAITIYPNPSDGEVTFLSTYGNIIKTIQLYDYTGKLFYNVNYINAQSYSIATNDFPPGYYCVKIISQVAVLTQILLIQ